MIIRYFSLASIILLFMVGCGKKTGTKDSNVGTTSYLNLEKGSYNIIREKSELKWTGKELSSKTHTGTLLLKEGRINIDSNGMIEGKVVIDMTSINVTDLQGEWKDKLERHLKSPDFLTSALYIKKPERIEALLMVMTTCLMVYASLEHIIRKKLKEQAEYFPDMKKKPTQRPTARWVFQCFAGRHA